MGDRYSWEEKCPQCKGVMEYYDAPSSLMYIGSCNECKYRDPLGYYEAPDNHIELCTHKEAVEKGLVMDCPKCHREMTWWEKIEYQKCIMCNQENK